MKHPLIVLTLLLVPTIGAIAQAPAFNVEWTTLGDVRLAQSNYGICGHDVQKLQAGLIYPRSGGLQYLFGSGLWLGGVVHAGDGLQQRVLATYDVLTGLSSAVPGELKNGRGVRPDLSARYQVQRSVSNGVEVLTSRYHLGDTTRYPVWSRTSIRGLSDLEVRERVYSFSNEAMANTVIRTIDIVNTGVDTVFQFVLGWVLDPDVGDPTKPIEAAKADRHRIETLDNATHFYVARDDDDETTGEIAFGVLDGQVDGGGLTIVDKIEFAEKNNHVDRYVAMTSRGMLGDIFAQDVGALYAITRPGTFAPGDTLRYSTAFILMSPSERRERLVSGQASIRQFYIDATARCRVWLANQPTSVADVVVVPAEAATVVPHPVRDMWTLYAPTAAEWEVVVYSINGQMVYRSVTDTDGTLQGPALETGVYYLTLRRNGVNTTQCLVKSH